MNIRSEIREFDRHDIYEIPQDAWREAILNAIIHRDYSFKGTSIYVMVYDDRVEIENPGKLLSGITVKSLGQSSVRRNPIIADLFHRLGKVERIGSGIKRMRVLMREAGLKDPVFEADAFFRVTFYRDSKYSLKGGQKGLVEGLAEGLADSQKKILSLVGKNSRISKRDLSEKVGISTTAIDKNIQVLKKKGLLKRVGSAKGGHWQVVEK